MVPRLQLVLASLLSRDTSFFFFFYYRFQTPGYAMTLSSANYGIYYGEG